MRPCYERQVVHVIETFYNVSPKQKPGSPRTEAPAVNLVWIGPEEVAHGTFVRDFLLSVEKPDFVYGVDQGRETTVNAENGAARC